MSCERGPCCGDLCLPPAAALPAAPSLAAGLIPPGHSAPLLPPCSEAAHGGQVILSEKAWAAVQDQLPGQAHVVSLGTHILDPSPLAPPLLLMEVMPQGEWVGGLGAV